MTANHLPPGLRSVLAEKGMTQTEFARVLRVSESQVSRWANGLRPGSANRKRIARKLNVEETELWPG